MASTVDFPVIIFWRNEDRLRTELIPKCSAPTLQQTLGVLPFTLNQFGLKTDPGTQFQAFWLDSNSWIVDTSKAVDAESRGRPLVAVDSRLANNGIDHFRTLVGAVKQYEALLASANERSTRSSGPAPTSDSEQRVFISHGHATDWREVQAFIEKTLEIQTLELAQQPNKGRTVLEKLRDESGQCSFAVVIVSGDDRTSDGLTRARENVMHEIGYFQGKYGLDRVCLLYESGTSVPSNIAGLVSLGYPKGQIKVVFGDLTKELRTAFPQAKSGLQQTPPSLLLGRRS